MNGGPKDGANVARWPGPKSRSRPTGSAKAPPNSPRRHPEEWTPTPVLPLSAVAKHVAPALSVYLCGAAMKGLNHRGERRTPRHVLPAPLSV